ncbi:MAG: RHS repeat-associated core domain-containing protein, partial [Agathobacter sp.]|nr:RHS repeat-associated core domain-containing protein [Agathobacter sp.]
YHNGTQFEWENGRWLSYVTTNTDYVKGIIAHYDYNSDGLRIRKDVDGIVTEFYWLDECLIGQKTGNEYIVYLYDENGAAYGFLLTDGVTEAYYYYLFNLQGDIIGILDEQGNQVVEYSYDVWGYPLGVTGTMASTIGQKNPLRYRGYYYDSETGFYYVSSRYYDPEIGRFLNSDSIIDNRGVNTLNLFAYCGNNPIKNIDSSGQLFGAVIGGIIGGVLGGLTAAASGKSVKAGIVTGALTGAIIGGICDGSAAAIAVAAGTAAKCTIIAKTMLACAAVAATGNVANQAINYNREKKQYNQNQSGKTKTNSNKTTPPLPNDAPEEYQSFLNYIDTNSVISSAISAAICAPFAVGGGVIVDRALGVGTAGLSRVSQFIAESAMGANVSMLQTSVEYIIPIFEP